MLKYQIIKSSCALQKVLMMERCFTLKRHYKVNDLKMYNREKTLNPYLLKQLTLTIKILHLTVYIVIQVWMQMNLMRIFLVFLMENFF